MQGEFGSKSYKPRYVVRWYWTHKQLQEAFNRAWEAGYQRDDMTRENVAGVWGWTVVFRQVGATNGQEAKRDYQGEIRAYIARQEERREQDRRARLDGLEARELEEGAKTPLS